MLSEMPRRSSEDSHRSSGDNEDTAANESGEKLQGSKRSLHKKHKKHHKKRDQVGDRNDEKENSVQDIDSDGGQMHVSKTKHKRKHHRRKEEDRKSDESDSDLETVQRKSVISEVHVKHNSPARNSGTESKRDSREQAESKRREHKSKKNKSKENSGRESSLNNNERDISENRQKRMADDDFDDKRHYEQLKNYDTGKNHERRPRDYRDDLEDYRRQQSSNSRQTSKNDNRSESDEYSRGANFRNISSKGRTDTRRDGHYSRRNRNEERREKNRERSNSGEVEYRKKPRFDSRREGTGENSDDKKRKLGILSVDEEAPEDRTIQDSDINPKDQNGDPPTKKKKVEDLLTMKTGGAYIPPARLRAMQAQITDKSSAAYQRMAWEALKKGINGLINKINVSNLESVVKELFQLNIIRGRGLLARAVIQAQAASPTFTHVYAGLVAVINSRMPHVGELILRRLVLLFRKSFRRNNKTICLSSSRFIAHLVNQQVAHEVVSLEILTLLLENPTDDSVEVAISFLKECGMKLTEVSPRGINAIFDRLRSILHESQIDKRVQYMIEVAVQVRKDGFKDFPSVISELDQVEEDDQFTHMLTLEDSGDEENILNIFKLDPDFEETELKYKSIRDDLLESNDEENESGETGSESEEDEEEQTTTIIDNTETNLIALRRTIYLTIQSSLDYEECAHKMLKLELKPGQENELCHMILDCCAQQRTYEKFYGLLGQRFCQINKSYIIPFQEIFKQSYETIHRLETNKLRNVAKFYGHLLFTDAMSWEVLKDIHLNEDDTSSSSRIFIKILFLELAEYMGLSKLNERLKDPMLQSFFEGIMPKDNPRNTRFSINFFTSIGLGGLTDDMREHLKNAPKMIMEQTQEVESSDSSSSSSSDASSSSETSDSNEDSSDRLVSTILLINTYSVRCMYFSNFLSTT